MRLQALALGLLLFAAACGGGGSSAPVSGVITPAPAVRHDLHFGYYFGRSLYVGEQADHVTFFWVADPGDLAALEQAKAQAIPAIVLALPAYRPRTCTPVPEAELAAALQRIATAGLLERIWAVYPIDEPDIDQNGNCSDAVVTAQNAVVRRAMAGFPALVATKLAVIYACDSGRRPGQASYDLIGCDKYADGCAVLTRYLEPMKAALTPGQALLVVPGGADPWRQDPACFESYAHGEPRVAAIVAFLWQTENETRGIRENGPLAGLYRAAGRKIRG